MNTFYLDTVNKTANFIFEFDIDIIDDIKRSDYNARWNDEMRQWIIPINSYSRDNIKRIINIYNFTQVAEPVIEDVSYSYEQQDVDFAYLQGLCDSKDFAYTPRKYQLEALGYALGKGNVINGDDVGLGKTFESIMYAEVTNSFPCLVIVPASVKYNWEEKWLEITRNNREISVITSNEKKNNWQAEVCIINYDIIGKKQGTGTVVKFPELVKNDWKMIIFDEAHYLKEKRAQRSQAAKSIVKRDAVIQLLTGTAVMSKPVELWNLLILCKQDDKIAKDWHQFVTRYCGGYRGKFGWVTDGATNTLELNRKLRESCYIRREKRDVLDELPDVTKEVIQVPITNKRAIKSATDDFIKYIKEAKGDEAADKAMEAEHLVAIGVLRKLAIEGKVKAIDQFLKDWKQAGLGKLVIFGIHREPLQILSQKYKSDLIAGGTTAEQKQAIVKRWISNDELFLFANIQSAGTGVDGLQNVSSDMIIIELPWRPSDLTQTIGRLDRSGQKNATTIRFLLNETTIDQQMWEMLEDKEQVAEAVNKGVDVKRNKSGLKAVIKKILNQ